MVRAPSADGSRGRCQNTLEQGAGTEPANGDSPCGVPCLNPYPAVKRIKNKSSSLKEQKG